MREIRTSGSVGAPGGQPPGATRWVEADVSSEELACVLAANKGRRSTNVRALDREPPDLKDMRVLQP